VVRSVEHPCPCLAGGAALLGSWASFMAGLEALVAMGNRQGTNIQWVWQLAEVCAQLSFSGI